jgi:hypothetical protein
MANRKISDLTALTTPATGDLLPIVDISEAAAADKNKKITIGELFASIPAGTAAAPSIAFEGDANTGIYSPGADQVAISTNGTGRLFVDASGNIKVTTGEVFNTSAAGYIRVSGGDGAGSGASILAFGQSHGSAAGRLALTAIGSGSMQFSAGGNERMRIDSSGPVLVGGSSASGGALLQVFGDRIRISTAKTPASATATGTTGEIAWDANYIYVCTATNTWTRTAIATW